MINRISFSTLLAALMALVLTAAPSHAQMMGNMGLADPFSTEDVKDMAEVLSMTDEQRVTVLDMHQAYFQSFNEDRDVLVQAIQAAVREAQQTNDMSIYNEIGKMAQGFQASQDTNLEKLYEDIKLVLTEDQLAEWPRFEIRAYRKRTLPTVNGQGMTISGASTDLVGLYEEHIEETIEDDETKSNIGNILSQYEREMHSALQSFNKVKDETTERSLEIGTDWMNNMGTIDEIIKDWIAAAIDVRDVNDRYTGRIAATLTADAKATWDEKYNRDATPAVYTPNYVHETFDAALELGDLTEEQKSQIEDIRRSYEASARSINKDWTDALRESQENISFQAMMSGQLQSAEANEFKTARGELDAQTYESVADVLTDEQAEKLPAKPASDWRNRFQFNNGQ